MSWSYDQIKADLAKYYPRARVWTAHINENEYGIDLDGSKDGMCNEITGYAIDLNGDGLADRFLFDGADGSNMSVTAANLDRFVNPFASFRAPEAANSSQVCSEPAKMFPAAPFPYEAPLLPDSSGRITNVLFVAHSMHARAMVDFIRHRPGMKCNIQTPTPSFIPNNLDSVEEEYLKTHERYLPRELAEFAREQGAIANASALLLFSFAPARFTFPIKALEQVVWPQDRLVIGKNEFGENVVSIQIPPSFMFGSIRVPYLRTLGDSGLEFSEYQDEVLVDGGDVISTKTHVFRNTKTNTGRDGNFWQVFAGDKKTVFIDLKGVPSASHLDMVLTPTDEIVDGKPLVFVAESHRRFYESTTSEDQCLDTIAAKLREQGFYVKRIPCILEEVKFLAAHWAYSYNNVLMERYEENGKIIRRVYMPWYDTPNMRDTNESARSAYQEFGYEVIPIHGLDSAAISGGSLRCLVKVIDRDRL